jgi:hypothetical protein
MTMLSTFEVQSDQEMKERRMQAMPGGNRQAAAGIVSAWRAARILVMACVIGLSTACTAIKFGYSQADHLLFLTFDRYLDINTNYEIRFKERIREYVAWHRRTQLRGYVQLMQEAQQRVQGPVTKSEVALFNGRALERGRIMVQRAIPDLAELALNLGPENLEQLEKKFKESNADFRKDHLRGSVEARKEKRFDKTLDRYEYWFGRLNDEQRERLRRQMDAQTNNDELRLAERQRRQTELVDLLRRVQAERPAAAVVEGWLREYFQRVENPPSAELRALLVNGLDQNAENMALVINMATPEQRAEAQKTLQGWVEDLLEMAGAGR